MVVRVAAVETPLWSTLELGEWEMGGGNESGEEGQAPHPFIGSEGGAGGTGKGIGQPVVAASMLVVWFGGEGKQRGHRGGGSMHGRWRQRHPVELLEEEDDRAD
jgi:hypothetical protein